MIGVMFRYSKNVTTEDGHPLTKVYMFDEGSRIRDTKVSGFRPEVAYVFATTFDNTERSEELMDWMHKDISYSLHPRKGQVIYQNTKVRNLFALI